MLTTDPPPRATRCGHAARVTRKTMSSSLRIVNDQSSYDSSSIAPNRIADALLTSTSTPPAERGRLVHPAPRAVLGGQVDRRDRVHPSARPRGPGRPSPATGRVQVAADDVRALAGEDQRRRPPDPATGAGDERDLAVQPTGHASPWPLRPPPRRARRRRSSCRGPGSAAGSGTRSRASAASYAPIASSSSTSPRAATVELLGQQRRVVERQVGAHAQRREHAVRGVADDGDPRRLPALRRLQEPERDHEDRVEVDAGRPAPARPGASPRRRRASSRAGSAASRRSTRSHGGTTVPGDDAAADHHVRRRPRRPSTSGAISRGGLVGRPARPERRDEQPRALLVDGHQHALVEDVRHQLRRSSGVSGVRP